MMIIQVQLTFYCALHMPQGLKSGTWIRHNP